MVNINELLLPQRDSRDTSTEPLVSGLECRLRKKCFVEKQIHGSSGTDVFRLDLAGGRLLPRSLLSSGIEPKPDI